MAERVEEIRACARAEEQLKALSGLVTSTKLERSRAARRAGWLALAQTAQERVAELDRAAEAAACKPRGTTERNEAAA